MKKTQYEGKHFPELIIWYREKKGWSQDLLGEKIGVNSSAISQLENKKDAHAISFKRALRLITALGLVGSDRDEAESAAIDWNEKRADKLKYEIGPLIVEIMKKLGVRTIDIAKHFQKDDGFVSAIRKGKRTFPPPDKMEKRISYFESRKLLQKDRKRLIRTYVSDALKKNTSITTFLTQAEIEKMLKAVFGKSLTNP